AQNIGVSVGHGAVDVTPTLVLIPTDGSVPPAASSIGAALQASQGEIATNVRASLRADNLTESGNPVTIHWSVPASTSNSYVVYDASPHSDIDQYRFQSDSAAASGGAASVNIGGTDVRSGDTLYFRVVTVDSTGTIVSWTAEQRLVVPPRLTAF